MSWASQRKLTYAGAVLITLVALISIPLYLQLHKAPTCFDGEQNGDETAVDKGGSCDALNPADLNNLIVHWSRPFSAGGGMYDAVAYVENTNFDAGIESIIYKFKLYDKDNILITEKLGKTFVGPSEGFAVFEGGLRTGERIPKRAFFEFEPEQNWQRVRIPKEEIPHISVKNQELTNLSEKPRLKATLVNDTSFPVQDIEAIAIIYDSDDNAVAVSATHVESISGYDAKDISFTWQNPFDATPVRIDIIPRTNIFLSGAKGK